MEEEESDVVVEELDAATPSTPPLLPLLLALTPPPLLVIAERDEERTHHWRTKLVRSRCPLFSPREKKHRERGKNLWLDSKSSIFFSSSFFLCFPSLFLLLPSPPVLPTPLSSSTMARGRAASTAAARLARVAAGETTSGVMATSSTFSASSSSSSSSAASRALARLFGSRAAGLASAYGAFSIEFCASAKTGKRRRTRKVEKGERKC